MAIFQPPPVEYLSPLEPWDSPQYIPPSPHNLPARPDPAVDVTADFGRGETLISEPYRYASIVALTFITSTTSIKFLDQPIGKRNLLGFRNVSTVAGQIIFIGFGRDATTQSWLRLTPGTIVLFDTVVPQDDLYAVCEAGTPVLSYIYSTFPG